MSAAAPDFGECFANVTGMIEDAHGIAVAGQSHSLSHDEHAILLQQLHKQIGRIAEALQRIESAL